jgi:hypothetical protein
MEQSRSSEANISLATIDVPRILWDLGVYFLVKNSLPLDPTLRQSNPVKALRAYKFKIYLAYLAIHISVLLLHQIPACTSVLPRKCQVYCTSHPQRYDEKHESVLSSQLTYIPQQLSCDNLNHVLPLT